MSDSMFDSNQFVGMVNILNIYTTDLKDEALEISLGELEKRWKELLSTLNELFGYAQRYQVDLRDYKTDLKEIVGNLYAIEKIVQKRKDKKVAAVDEMAEGIIYIAGRIDDILDSIGWKRVVRPITEAIFLIPKRVISMFSKEKEAPSLLSDSAKKYLPPPIRSLPTATSLPAKKENDSNDIIIDGEVEWIEREETNESFASQVLRRMHSRIERREVGDELES